ncbi:MAG: hypothetical protein WDN45_12600 [Caulobacteraceae bacterium]
MADVVGVQSRPIPAALFAGAVFVSAGLVFLVEPMIARMVLPLLGGSLAVWNTSLAFFQAALLAGYAYAHGLQRVRGLKAQMAIHVAALALAALALPLRISEVFGPPSLDQPALWLLGVLTVSVGAPFAVLSAHRAPVAGLVRAAQPGRAGGRGPLYPLCRQQSSAACWPWSPIRCWWNPCCGWEPRPWRGASATAPSPCCWPPWRSSPADAPTESRFRPHRPPPRPSPGPNVWSGLAWRRPPRPCCWASPPTSPRTSPPPPSYGWSRWRFIC